MSDGALTRPTLLLTVLLAAPALADPATVPHGPAAIPILGDVWQLGVERIYPEALAGRFDPKTRGRLEARLQTTDATLADTLNPFLESLGVSHTRFYDRRHQSYYMLRAMFATHDLHEPRFYTLGVQFHDDDPERIRAVFEGTEAARAGLERGQRIVAVNDEPFTSLLQWQRPEPVRLTLATAAGRLQATVTPVLQSFPEALLAATAASDRIVECGDRRIGYLHLWAGTSDAFLEIERRAVANALAAGVDGYILDLRDGYGGAWWPYLDPFFEDRNDYFTYTTIDRDGESPPISAAAQANPDAWLGPLAVIINDGTRSGKESLAFQFRRSGRAPLIGSNTAGAFVAGYGAFADRPVDYTMMMSVEEFRLDGAVIEGVGVAPDVPVSEQPGTDAPLAAALAALSCSATG